MSTPHDQPQQPPQQPGQAPQQHPQQPYAQQQAQQQAAQQAQQQPQTMQFAPQQAPGGAGAAPAAVPQQGAPATPQTAQLRTVPQPQGQQQGRHSGQPHAQQPSAGRQFAEQAAEQDGRAAGSGQPGAPAGHAAEPGGYRSPIPINRTHLGHAVASEWTKIRSVRSTMWTLGIMVVLLLGLDLLVATAVSSHSMPEKQMFTPVLFGLLPGCICVITLGALVVTSEYGTGMIRATMTACPARGRVLAAKALVFFLLAFVVTTVTCSLAALLNSALLDTIDSAGLAAESSDWINATLGEGLFVALLGLLTLGVGTLLRHSAGTITAMLGAVLLPMVAGPILMQIPSLNTAGEKLLEYSPLSGLGSFVSLPFGPEKVDAWGVFGGYAVVTAAVLAGGFALLRTRDV